MTKQELNIIEKIATAVDVLVNNENPKVSMPNGVAPRGPDNAKHGPPNGLPAAGHDNPKVGPPNGISPMGGNDSKVSPLIDVLPNDTITSKHAELEYTAFWEGFQDEIAS
jgi:hypothetical protein